MKDSSRENPVRDSTEEKGGTSFPLFLRSPINSVSVSIMVTPGSGSHREQPTAKNRNGAPYPEPLAPPDQGSSRTKAFTLWSG